jgi:hypothetical protein
VHVGGENAPPWCGISGPLELAETGSICGGRLSNLSVWRLRRGIYLERITPGYPEAHGGTSACTSLTKTAAPKPPRPTSFSSTPASPRCALLQLRASAPGLDMHTPSSRSRPRSP